MMTLEDMMSETNEQYVNPYLEADRLYASPLAQEMLRGYDPPPLEAEALSLSGRMPWDDDEPAPKPEAPIAAAAAVPPEGNALSRKSSFPTDPNGPILRVVTASEIARARYTAPPFVVDGLISDIPRWGWQFMTMLIAISFATMVVTFFMRKSRDWDKEHGPYHKRRRRK